MIKPVDELVQELEQDPDLAKVIKRGHVLKIVGCDV